VNVLVLAGGREYVEWRGGEGGEGGGGVVESEVK
jgi:hypothetical protein